MRNTTSRALNKQLNHCTAALFIQIHLLYYHYVMSNSAILTLLRFVIKISCFKSVNYLQSLENTSKTLHGCLQSSSISHMNTGWSTHQCLVEVMSEERCRLWLVAASSYTYTLSPELHGPCRCDCTCTGRCRSQRCSMACGTVCWY